MSQTLRFGICTDQNLPWPATGRALALFERLGFDSVWDCDHFVQPSRPTGRYFEGWTLLAGAGGRTERIRLGVLVSCNTFRHPALLAKEAVTVDHISNGRLEFGLGAGWYAPEHEQFGLDFPASRPSWSGASARRSRSSTGCCATRSPPTRASTTSCTTRRLAARPDPAAAPAADARRAPAARCWRSSRGTPTPGTRSARVEEMRERNADPRRAVRRDRPRPRDDLPLALRLGGDDAATIRGRRSTPSRT